MSPPPIPPSSAGSEPSRRPAARLALAAAIVLLLAAVVVFVAGGGFDGVPQPTVSATPSGGDQPSPSTAEPTASPSPSPSVTARPLHPGVAETAIEEILAAAGTTHAVKVDITAEEVTVAVVTGRTARTFAWRSGVVSAIESDTAYVGQVIFDPRDFALADPGALLRRAGTIAGSTAGQQLQIVEYDDRAVYMTVTTTPESRTVFYRPDGSLVAALDVASEAGLAEGWADAVGSLTAVRRITVSTAGESVAVETPGAPGSVVTTTRSGFLPPRSVTRSGDDADLLDLDPGVVDPAVVARLIAAAPGLTGAEAEAGVVLVVEHRAGEDEPLFHLTVDDATVDDGVVTARLDGTII
ncbi:MAG: hypothetical protein LBM23_01460 [Propionibacteriaceae bacterium]|jgi:hypothetical protein|nr:hypothetical protein [Propionibacteriaceae bacterium]